MKFIIISVLIALTCGCVETQEQLKSANDKVKEAQALADKAKAFNERVLAEREAFCSDAKSLVAIAQALQVVACLGENVPEFCKSDDLQKASENVTLACDLGKRE